MDWIWGLKEKGTGMTPELLTNWIRSVCGCWEQGKGTMMGWEEENYVGLWTCWVRSRCREDIQVEMLGKQLHIHLERGGEVGLEAVLWKYWHLGSNEPRG